MDKKLKAALEATKHSGVVDISKISEYREMEQYQADMQDAAGRCKEITDVGKALFVRHEDMSAVDAINAAEAFYEAASVKVNEIMDSVKTPDAIKDSKLTK